MGIGKTARSIKRAKNVKFEKTFSKFKPRMVFELTPTFNRNNSSVQNKAVAVYFASRAQFAFIGSMASSLYPRSVPY